MWEQRGVGGCGSGGARHLIETDAEEAERVGAGRGVVEHVERELACGRWRGGAWETRGVGRVCEG